MAWLFTPFEILDVLLMSVALGYIFKDAFGPQRHGEEYDPLHFHLRRRQEHWKDILYAALIVAPGIIVHELGHKFVALAFGAVAPTFYAACSSSALVGGSSLFDFPCLLMVLALVLKAVGSGFLFFIPGYVAYSAQNITPMASLLIALAGPLVNLAFWGIPKLFLNYGHVKRKWIKPLMLMSTVNGFLFILNILPLPGFDGFHVFQALFRLFF